tara:strand:+ start:1558 stop:1686 length:129 start_codon:yes stop_codon:yes gene_type:complete
MVLVIVAAVSVILLSAIKITFSYYIESEDEKLIKNMNDYDKE